MNNEKWDLVLQNNASKEFFLFSGLTDLSTTHLYHQFDLDLSGCSEGEYTYAVLLNQRDDVEYEFRTPLLSSILHTEDGDIVLRDVQPGTGILRIGEHIQPINIYDNNDTNTVFYYDE